MIDIKLIRENLDLVKERIAARGATVDWDGLQALDRERREAVFKWESLKEKKNRMSAEIGKAKRTGADASELMAEIEQLTRKIDEATQPLDALEKRFQEA